MEHNAKLFIVTRADLSPAQQAVQGMHAQREFIARHPSVDAEWYSTSNHLAFLSVADEGGLHRLVHDAQRRGFRFAVFQEPDRGNEMTALALEPAAKRLCRGLDLALRQNAA